MKKRIMLAMAVIMVLGSVKAAMASEMDMETAEGKWAASEENMMMNDPDTAFFEINTATKIEANMADLAGRATRKEDKKIEVLESIRSRMETLKSLATVDEEVRIGSDVVSVGQALSISAKLVGELQANFQEKKALKLVDELDQAIRSARLSH